MLGARIDELDFVYKKFFVRNEQLIAKKNIKLTVNTKLREASKDFIVRITSLDTHEKKEYKLQVNNKQT